MSLDVQRRTGVADVLVTDDGAGQGRSALAAVRALAAAGHRPAVARSGAWSLAASSRYAVRTVDVGPPSDEGYGTAIERIATALAIREVFPSSDAALLALGRPVAHLLDKTLLAPRATAAGFAVPETEVFPSADALRLAANRLPYPVVVKQPVSRVPARRFDDARALESIEALDGPLLVQPFLDEPLRAVGGVVRGGRFVAAVHQRYLRTWPHGCGTASAAITVEPEPAVEERLTALLDGYDGIFQAQLAGEHLLDLNPRVYGSLPLAVAAGANLPAIVCALGRGEAPAMTRARPGVRYRWVEGDLRAIAAGVRSRRLGPSAAMRAVMPRRGTAHSVASLRDPRPLATRAAYALRGRR